MDSRPAGSDSSTVEEGFPKEDVNLSYNSWSEIVERYGDTRLEGGMHYTASVPEGENLCAGIGDIVVNAFKELEQGESPTYFMTDFYASNVVSEKRCSMDDVAQRILVWLTKLLSMVYGAMMMMMEKLH